ncbi:amidohydrolase [Propionispora vibrioides]|uniref:5-methylthioadenosine/S-adenosylhomocysteine deaminase n=1 Tax=Propionispora vibrioides TaxID=112903 RepID=A0A1H8NK32_9FIRM|nr:amidohydrolase [Propionispora vibrioides]SEO29733.1 5-methylthioadenosine/S-adenosylhomocysteine deaminase [Propionispora vibrioides]
MPQTIILKNVELLSDCDELIQTDITISDDCITSIGTAMETGDKARVIDCIDKLAIPGLINTHTHAAMSLFRSYADDMLLMDWLENKIWPAEANLTAEDVYYGTLLAIAEMLKTGTTTFADMYFYMPQVAEAVAESGIRAVLARGMTGLGANALQSLAESEAFYRDYHHTADERITVMLGPHAPYTCPPDYLKKVVALAQKLGAEIHIHLSETAGEVENCFKQYGKSPIELMSELGVLDCGVLAAHCVHVSTEDIQIMRQKQVRVAHNPGSNMKLASGIAPVPQMLAAGLCVGLGTDGAASNNNLDMLEEIRLTALLHKVSTRDPLVIPAQTAVKMATAFGAQALGLSDKVGRLAPGLKADIVLLDMNSPHWCPRHNRLSLLAYSASAGDVHTVIANGKIVVENRRLITIDEEKLLYEAHKRSMRLTGK